MCVQGVYLNLCACLHVWGAHMCGGARGHMCMSSLEAGVGNYCSIILLPYYLMQGLLIKPRAHLFHSVSPLASSGDLLTPLRLELDEGSHSLRISVGSGSPNSSPPTWTANTLHTELPLQVFVRQRSRDKIVLDLSRFQINN